MSRLLIGMILAGLFAVAGHPALAQQQIVLEEGVTYSRAGGTPLKLDIARPVGKGPFPALVFIHGGGWLQGHRSAHAEQIKAMAKNGYVSATISYRLMQFDMKKKETAKARPIFPAQVHDAKAAIRWLRANADKYHVDPERIAVAGASAGGHLALMVGLTDASDGLEGNGGHSDQSSRVRAVINIFGPTEMASCYEASSVAWMLRLFMGGTPEEVPDVYKKASPVTYISEDDPPVLTLHGALDTLVPIQQALLLDEKFKAAGVEHTLLVFPAQGHSLEGGSKKRAVQVMVEFLEKHLGK